MMQSCRLQSSINQRSLISTGLIIKALQQFNDLTFDRISGSHERESNKPVGDMDLRDSIAVLRLDLYKYRDYPYLEK